jgi:predicted nucleic acid-binding protein
VSSFPRSPNVLEGAISYSGFARTAKFSTSAAAAPPERKDAIADGVTLEVPALWPLEAANALIVLVRRRKLAEDERQVGLGWLRRLRIRVDHEMSALAFSRLSELAAAHQLSVYDAAYLELAARRRLVLGCKSGLRHC